MVERCIYIYIHHIFVLVNLLTQIYGGEMYIYIYIYKHTSLHHTVVFDSKFTPLLQYVNAF